MSSWRRPTPEHYRLPDYPTRNDETPSRAPENRATKLSFASVFAGLAFLLALAVLVTQVINLQAQLRQQQQALARAAPLLEMQDLESRSRAAEAKLAELRALNLQHEEQIAALESKRQTTTARIGELDLSLAEAAAAQTAKAAELERARAATAVMELELSRLRAAAEEQASQLKHAQLSASPTEAVIDAMRSQDIQKFRAGTSRWCPNFCVRLLDVAGVLRQRGLQEGQPIFMAISAAVASGRVGVIYAYDKLYLTLPDP